MTYSLSRGSVTVTLDNIQVEEVTKDSGTVIYPIPGEDSGETILIDLGGCTEVIHLTGMQSFANSTERSNFVNNLRGFIDGGQTISGATTYTSDLIGSVSVIVFSVRVSYEAGSPLLIKYDIQMYRGSV